jgi:hypothetical protein
MGTIEIFLNEIQPLMDIYRNNPQVIKYLSNEFLYEIGRLQMLRAIIIKYQKKNRYDICQELIKDKKQSTKDNPNSLNIELLSKEIIFHLDAMNHNL